MNDIELDEMLDRWTSPAAPASLSAKVRANCDSRPKRRTRSGVWAYAGIAAILLVGVRAFPQKLTLLSSGARIPYTVDSEFFQRREDGSTEVAIYSSSYSREGREVFLSKSVPGDPWGTVMLRARDFGAALLRPIQELSLPLVASPEQIQKVRALARIVDCTGGNCTGGWILGNRTELLRSGCELAPVAGHETILGYPTVAIQRGIGSKRRMTVWMAPALGCFPLKSMVEEQQVDGAFHAIRGRRALKITVNP
jgi:hypothetical protein